MSNSEVPQNTDDPRHALISRVARRVREVRKQKGMPRRVVSELSGVSPRYLAQLEAGEGNISIALLERVARALGMPMEVLIARNICVDPEAQRIAQLFEKAPDDIRAAIKDLLQVDKSASLRAGRICLMGLRGAGKTTLGRNVAKAFDLPFIELSSMVEDDTGIPLAEVLSLYGPEGFRRLEAEALERVIKRTGPFILSVSGGLVEQEAPFARLLSRCYTIWLQTSPAEHVARVRPQGAMQLAGDDEQQAVAKIKSLVDMRTPLYERAHAQLDTTRTSAQKSVRDLVSLITQMKFLTH
ncbi:shikimate kinase [Sulfitobacter guttiformis]|uniref:Shikimate kinase n=1 Tax=Sulfitobacter guttiformis TaxID=74349 RepID=A0A420DQN8_9RHOB|nr:shikimate kinase [Sulfitobacter guttiformis]RKE96634.1 XRE family transcriptional regulator [Sulfitobacter guttiformis]